MKQLTSGGEEDQGFHITILQKLTVQKTNNNNNNTHRKTNTNNI